MFLSLADLPVRDALPGLRVWVETARLACHEKPAGLLIILRDLEWPFPDLCILTTNFDKKITLFSCISLACVESSILIRKVCVKKITIIIAGFDIGLRRQNKWDL